MEEFTAFFLKGCVDSIGFKNWFKGGECFKSEASMLILFGISISSYGSDPSLYSMNPFLYFGFPISGRGVDMSNTSKPIFFWFWF